MANKQQHLLSTSDNPWNPWTHFKEWYAWDTQAGHHTLPYLARVTNSSSELSTQQQEIDVEVAIEEIIRLNVNGLYVAVPEPK
jgi:hypothetical protein